MPSTSNGCLRPGIGSQHDQHHAPRQPASRIGRTIGITAAPASRSTPTRCGSTTTPGWNPAREKTPAGFDTIEFAIAEIAAGRAVVVVDDEDRENEGDLIFAAELATPELVAFTVRYSSGRASACR